jgi:hypothetical protein
MLNNASTPYSERWNDLVTVDLTLAPGIWENVRIGNCLAAGRIGKADTTSASALTDGISYWGGRLSGSERDATVVAEDCNVPLQIE